MFENTEMTEVVKQFLPVLFSTFLLRMGSTNGIETKSAFGRNPIEFESNIALLKLKNPSTILLFFLFFFFFFLFLFFFQRCQQVLREPADAAGGRRGPSRRQECRDQEEAGGGRVL